MLRFASLLYICSVSFAAVSPAATPGPQVPALTFTNTFPQNVPAGQDLLISWTGGTTMFNLILDVKSKPETLSYIASNLTANSFLWQVPISMPADFFYVVLNDTTGLGPNTHQLTLVNQALASSSTSPSSQSLGSAQASAPSPPSTTPSLVQTPAIRVDGSTTNLGVQSTSPSVTSAQASLPALTIAMSLSSPKSSHANPTSSALSPPSKVSSSTPTAARMGLGIGISLGVVAVIGLLALFFHFGRKYAARAAASKSLVFQKPQLEVGEVVKTMPRLPSMGKGPYELDGKSRSIRRAELG